MTTAPSEFLSTNSVTLPKPTRTSLQEPKSTSLTQRFPVSSSRMFTERLLLL